MQTPDNQTPQTPQNLAETQPASCIGARPVEARQVHEMEAVAQALENLARHWNRMGRMIEADHAARTTYEIGKVDSLDDCRNDLRSLMERLSLVPASGASAHIEPSLNAAGQRQAPAQSQQPTENRKP